MKHPSSTRKTARTTASTSNPDASAGLNGIAVTPPAYGMDVADHQPIQAASEHGQEYQPLESATWPTGEGTIQRQAGQERHLPHEAWHVVQQKQGRVKPTIQAQGISLNNNEGLEREADRMGGVAFNTNPISKHPPILLSDNPRGNIVQRKVGFEFQTNLGVGIADKGKQIFLGEKEWYIEGDQGELEFVTEPFNEEGSQPELKQMQLAVTQIAEMAGEIEQIGRERGYGGEAIPLTGFKKYGTPLLYKHKYVDITVGAWVFTGVSASPQVTGGVSLGNIGRLMETTLLTKLPINKEITEGEPDLKELYQRDKQGFTAGGQNFEKYSELFPRAQDLAVMEMLQVRLDLLKLGADPMTAEERARVEGFLTYVFLYLLLGANQQQTTDQTKYVFALMSRTSFSAMFKSLPEEYRILEYFPDEILERSGIGDGDLFNKGMKYGGKIYRGPTRKEWLISIEEGRDLLSSAHSDNPLVREEEFGSPALGKYGELESDVRDGVLIEIRSLPKEVTPPYWVAMATTLFNMFRQVQSQG